MGFRHCSCWHSKKERGQRSGIRVIKLFLCSTQLIKKLQLLIKTKMPTNEEVFLALSLSYVVFIMLMNVKMPTIVGILTFMSRITWCSAEMSIEKKFNNLGIRNWYNQVPHLTRDTNGKVTNTQLDITNESQEVSPFPAGDHKASINRHAWKHNTHKTEITWMIHKRSIALERSEKIFY